MKLLNHALSSNPIVVEPYLQTAINEVCAKGSPASLYKSTSTSAAHSSKPDTSTWPTLKHDQRNKILLFPGSFNPPHQGHLATIRYFSKHREEFNIIAMILFVDPENIVRSKEKKWGDNILPQELRYKMFAEVPELAQLIDDRWLYLLVGDMESHIEVLRITTDLVSNSGYDAQLVGFLGGDKLSIKSPPHLPPGELTMWGPVDEFLIINARRPVDFFDAGEDSADASLHDLPGCTKWERGDSGRSLTGGPKGSVGVLWKCRALTVPGQPYIQFRASSTNASNGISSTRIRQIMSEANEEELYEKLKDQVLSAKFLVD
jgi:hypothetical protein